LITQTNENTGKATLLSTAKSRKKKGKNAAEESASVEQIERFQEQINDLEARCTARQEQIDEVSFVLPCQVGMESFTGTN
jgi:hypothetical protein